jgi:hypothetical protein
MTTDATYESFVYLRQVGPGIKKHNYEPNVTVVILLSKMSIVDWLFMLNF